MKDLLYAGATALLFSYLLMPLLTRFLQSRKLMDEGGYRKIHKGFKPSMGGLVIVVSLVAAMLLWMPSDMLERRYQFAAIALIFFAGIRDDLVPLRPLHKVIVQVVAAVILVLPGDVRISSLYGLFGVHELPEWISCILSMLVVITITNAFNLIDGIDGLAGSVAVVTFSFLCFWFYGIGDHSSALYLMCVIGAILGFLYYNWQPASIFMGDTGSLSLGMILSLCTVSFIKINGELPADDSYHFPAVLTAGLAIVLLPIYDTIRVFLYRLQHGKSPFKPDKMHTHHLVLYTQKKSHARTVLRLLSTYIFIAALLLLACKFFPDWVLLPILVAIYCFVTLYLRGSIKKNIQKKRTKNRQLVEYTKQIKIWEQDES